MDFTKLDISRAAVLKKEVDLAVKFIKEATAQGQTTRCKELLEIIWAEIANINVFTVDHHDDERSVLFEKEKKRLLLVLQELGLPLSAKENVERASRLTDQKRKERAVKAAKAGARGLGKTNTEEAEISDKPIYTWELGNIDITERKPISNEYGTFLPSTKSGIYSSVGDVYNNNSQDSIRHIDFQVVLTEEELMTVVNRQRAVKTEQLHRQRFTEKRAETRLGIMASSPYIDKRRVQNEIYRHDHPNKWTNRKGFQPAGPALKSLKASGSLVQ